jgi:hypothetical protein
MANSVRDVCFTPESGHHLVIFALSSYRLDGSRTGPFGSELHRVAVKVVDVDAAIDDGSTSCVASPGVGRTVRARGDERGIDAVTKLFFDEKPRIEHRLPANRVLDPKRSDGPLPIPW